MILVGYHRRTGSVKRELFTEIMAAEITKFSDRELMLKTIELARQCKGEKADPTPKVAAIITRDGVILGTAFRGEIEPGDHAEFTVLEKKLKGEDLSNATIFTTLEPCTRRSIEKTPCALRIIDRGIKRVVIGTIDRDPNIQGYGHWKLRDAGITVSYFDSELAEELESINQEFLTSQKQRAEAALEAELGHNGFPIGYDEEGNQVEWIEEDGEKWPMIIRRSDSSISEQIEELTARVWYVRKLVMFEHIEDGKEDPLPQDILDAVYREMAVLEEKYGAENLVYDDWNWGFVNGKMSALRWAFGDEWESSLDT